MELEVFAGQEKSELSMIEVARAILETRRRDEEMFFSELVNAIQEYLGKSDADIREALPYFYADLNTDGSFIPLGENKWGLRSWYAIDEIDEEIITLEETMMKKLLSVLSSGLMPFLVTMRMSLITTMMPQKMMPSVVMRST